MRKHPFWIGIAALLLIALPAPADEARDYIDNEVEEWHEVAEGNGYNILGTYIGAIGEDDITYLFDLAPGVYHFYASGGMYVEDLDSFAYDKDGEELDNDTLPDKIPILVLELTERQEVEIVGSAWSLDEGHDQGYFCLVVTCEDEGEIHSVSGGPSDSVEEEPTETKEDLEDEDYDQERAD